MYTALLHELLGHLREADEFSVKPLRAEALGRRFVALANEDEPHPALPLRFACARCYVYLGDVAQWQIIYLELPAAVASAHGRILSASSQAHSILSFLVFTHLALFFIMMNRRSALTIVYTNLHALLHV